MNEDSSTFILFQESPAKTKKDSFAGCYAEYLFLLQVELRWQLRSEGRASVTKGTTPRRIQHGPCKRTPLSRVCAATTCLRRDSKESKPDRAWAFAPCLVTYANLEINKKFGTAKESYDAAMKTLREVRRLGQQSFAHQGYLFLSHVLFTCARGFLRRLECSSAFEANTAPPTASPIHDFSICGPSRPSAKHVA